MQATQIAPLIDRNKNIVLLKQGHLTSPLAHSVINNLASIRTGIFNTRISKLSEEKAVEKIKPPFVLVGELVLQVSALCTQVIVDRCKIGRMTNEIIITQSEERTHIISMKNS